MVAEGNILDYACRHRKRRWHWRFWFPASIITGFLLGAVSSSVIMLWMGTVGSGSPVKPAIWSIMEWLLQPVGGIIDWVLARSHNYGYMLLAMIVYFALLVSCACAVIVGAIAGVMHVRDGVGLAAADRGAGRDV